MQTWQLQQAKARLTECVNQAKKSPQIISKHNKPEVILISIELYNQLTNADQDIVAYFRNSPLCGLTIPARDRSEGRRIDL
jgi:prevent-host-death family protein